MGGLSTDGPSSIWSLSELQELEAVSEARRGAGFLSHSAGADQRRPLCILTQLQSHDQLFMAWPRLFVYHDGLLPNSCLCVRRTGASTGLQSKVSGCLFSRSSCLTLLALFRGAPSTSSGKRVAPAS